MPRKVAWKYIFAVYEVHSYTELLFTSELYIVHPTGKSSGILFSVCIAQLKRDIIPGINARSQRLKSPDNLIFLKCTQLRCTHDCTITALCDVYVSLTRNNEE